MRSSQFAIELPAPFDFRATITSTGWLELAPNSWDGATEKLRRVHRLPDGEVVLLTIRSASGAGGPGVDVTVESGEPLTAVHKEQVTAAVRRMLRADEDLSEFYALCEGKSEPWGRASCGLGRLLRSPSVYEDVVKTICTTNVQWGGAKGMVRRLVDGYGDPLPWDPSLRAFPTPETVAGAGLEVFGGTVRMGYRAPFVYHLSSSVAAGDLDLESLLDPAPPTETVKKRLLAIKGVGPYAAATLLALLGRYDDLGIDTAFRDFVRQRYFGGQVVPDEQAKAVYTGWGRWRYLAYWLDIWSYYQCRARMSKDKQKPA